MPDELTVDTTEEVAGCTDESAKAENPEASNFAAEFTVEREAKLFEAGSYPDKGIDVSEDDLDAMVASQAAIPIKIEHGDSPFDGVLGTCGALVRRGKELFGKMSFTDAAWQLLQSTKHRGLSCGIRRDKTGLAEVSLVRNPRIADAQVFSADEGIVGFTSDVPWTYNDGATQPKEVITMPDEIKTEISVAQALEVLRAAQPGTEAGKLLFSVNQEMNAVMEANADEVRKAAQSMQATMKAMQKMATDSTIRQFKADGKITPAAEPFARAILESKPLSTMTPLESECVNFSDAEGNSKLIHFAEAFAEFLRVMPASVNFGELARQAEAENDNLTMAQREMNAKLGVSDEAFKQFSRKNVAEEVR